MDGYDELPLLMIEQNQGASNFIHYGHNKSMDYQLSESELLDYKTIVAAKRKTILFIENCTSYNVIP